uniref:Uncharacterized protein n=1 Tax=Oryza brachyantha TaxID=4533 RepID=J3M3V0_ORYBR
MVTIYEKIFVNNTPFSSLENVRAENEEDFNGNSTNLEQNEPLRYVSLVQKKGENIIRSCPLIRDANFLNVAMINITSYDGSCKHLSLTGNALKGYNDWDEDQKVGATCHRHGAGVLAGLARPAAPALQRIFRRGDQKEQGSDETHRRLLDGDGGRRRSARRRQGQGHGLQWIWAEEAFGVRGSASAARWARGVWAEASWRGEADRWVPQGRRGLLIVYHRGGFVKAFYAVNG